MIIYVELNIYCVIVNEIKINLNHFSVVLRTSIYDIICVTYIIIMNDLRYNIQFYI